MAKKWYKDFMIRVTKGYYYFILPQTFALVSGLALTALYLCFQPLNEEVIPYHPSCAVKLFGGFVLFLSLLVNLQANYDMLKCDVYGIVYVRKIDPKGQEFPLPFVPKQLSRLAVCVRHPLFAAIILH
eukprot:CAMPEP_0202957412 /NCGR_PEP_ID=MMETSP1396-20130829/1812_1 /ASSEMBLY_ACC=CAM_ASM_000872 /TAXON_ID= /ORGANISM="Pseudokeronopsis sp., Strain Brazil" /LENGTH=127 /DNA_ID=CAMNT_0049674871 /DNA_START=255 /DNA_END=638 /DNA_ORIENTATION=+